MMQTGDLTREGVVFRTHDIVGIYPLGERIAYIHYASAAAEEGSDDGAITHFVLLDVFSANFDEHSSDQLLYDGQELLSASDSICDLVGDGLLLNTKGYVGCSPSLAKLIKADDAVLVEIGDAPLPRQQIYNDSKVYDFGAYEIYMASSFVMVCRAHMSHQVLWKLRLSAYLYTEVQERNGILYFGTAGKGGRFYGVNSVDGSVLFSYDTGGTVRFGWYNQAIVLADRKGKPTLLDAVSGVELKKIDLGKWRLTYDQFMLIVDERLYAVASGREGLCAVCVNLSE